ncbi:helix-turn-helix transcriptional regulator [Novosphingobium sp.]|uniref:helix-turn-helix domain-containing protein n=1 Tax=Novosphingobium sp. TaxID=1874826 RepID=UPI00260FE489|nr:helix-turn-helix transcriptional regulator [Novosphingobium sp.]
MAADAHWEKLLGENVRRLRKQSGMSQEELAYGVGVDVRYLGGIERAQENPSLKVLVQIAQCLDVQPHQLLLDQSEWD